MGSGEENEQLGGVGNINAWFRRVERAKDRHMPNLWGFMDCYPKDDKAPRKSRSRNGVDKNNGLGKKCL